MLKIHWMPNDLYSYLYNMNPRWLIRDFMFDMSFFLVSPQIVVDANVLDQERKFSNNPSSRVLLKLVPEVIKPANIERYFDKTEALNALNAVRKKAEASDAVLEVKYGHEVYFKGGGGVTILNPVCGEVIQRRTGYTPLEAEWRAKSLREWETLYLTNELKCIRKRREILKIIDAEFKELELHKRRFLGGIVTFSLPRLSLLPDPKEDPYAKSAEVRRDPIKWEKYVEKKVEERFDTIYGFIHDWKHEGKDRVIQEGLDKIAEDIEIYGEEDARKKLQGTLAYVYDGLTAQGSSKRFTIIRTALWFSPILGILASLIWHSPLTSLATLPPPFINRFIEKIRGSRFRKKMLEEYKWFYMLYDLQRDLHYPKFFDKLRLELKLIT